MREAIWRQSCTRGRCSSEGPVGDGRRRTRPADLVAEGPAGPAQGRDRARCARAVSTRILTLRLMGANGHPAPSPPHATFPRAWRRRDRVAGSGRTVSDVGTGRPWVGEVHPGTHVCALYWGPDERDRLLVPFMREGLRR